METHIASETPRRRARRSARVLAVSALGPLTMAVGVGWALVQPWRVTLLHPRGQGFWWLLSEPPLLVVLAGALFALVVAPGVLDDLETAEERQS
jgi:hypothetical protein